MRRSFDEPDERRVLAGGRVAVEIVELAGAALARVTHEPGWRWTAHSAAEAGAPRCPKRHVGVVVSGRLAVELADGSGYVAGPGDAVSIPPGHDAWTVGDEPAVLVELVSPAPLEAARPWVGRLPPVNAAHDDKGERNGVA